MSLRRKEDEDRQRLLGAEDGDQSSDVECRGLGGSDDGSVMEAVGEGEGFIEGNEEGGCVCSRGGVGESELLRRVSGDGDEGGLEEESDGDGEGDESGMTTPSAFVWCLTLCAGLSGLLFGYE